jgi:hypothetical protein
MREKEIKNLKIETPTTTLFKERERSLKALELLVRKRLKKSFYNTSCERKEEKSCEAPTTSMKAKE